MQACVASPSMFVLFIANHQRVARPNFERWVCEDTAGLTSVTTRLLLLQAEESLLVRSECCRDRQFAFVEESAAAPRMPLLPQTFLRDLTLTRSITKLSDGLGAGSCQLANRQAGSLHRATRLEATVRAEAVTWLGTAGRPTASADRASSERSRRNVGGFAPVVAIIDRTRYGVLCAWC